MKSFILLSGLLLAKVNAWAPSNRASIPAPTARYGKKALIENETFDPFHISNGNIDLDNVETLSTNFDPKPFLIPALSLATPTNAHAVAGDAAKTALFAYGHYISLLGILACVMVERLTIKPNMTVEEENRVVLADICFGLWGLLIVVTGYFRISAEKGFEFYSHEPLFWLKICFVGIFGAASLFNTTKIIQQAVKRQGAKEGEIVEPFSEALVNRMIQICNAELVAIATIPLTATFMARGIAYSNSIPWQVEAGLAAIVFGGLSFKYIKEAVTFEEA
mmetsp:Transcript_16886/g.23897  ORF Transcript_16886/g.23897 Transcript_16886/m.23897 type:complete len:278 (+) Transcript_16886:36-869(+)